MRIKIQISPEVREFNEAVESSDVQLDFAHDTCTAAELLVALKADGHLPAHAEWLANAMAAIAIKR